MSYLAWIDFDPEERRRAQTLIDLFKQPEARDELGLGTIRDALSDVLFPGTSTIQTRLRYMLFIPWIFLDAQSRKLSQADRVRVCRDLEIQLSFALLNGGETDGVIGREAGDSLKRLPSSVYWAGLATWGIRLQGGTARMYLSHGPEWLSDRDHLLWSAVMPKAPPDFLKSSQFQLSTEEADFFRGRLAAEVSGTLLGELSNTGERFAVDWPWELHHPAISKRSIQILDHARRYALVMNGAALLYNLMLAERAKVRPSAKVHGEAEGLVDAYSQDLTTWAVEMEANDFDTWNLSELFSIVGQTNHRLSGLTRTFVESWTRQAIAAPHEIISSDSARLLLVSRESRKKSKSRLSQDAPLDRWSGASGANRMNFRWNIARSYLEDMANADG